MIIGIVVVVVVAAGMAGYHAYANRELEVVVADDVPGDVPDLPQFQPDESQEEATELMALVDSEEEAEEVAALYDISLSSYAYGVAIYTTDRDVDEVIQEGIEKGYPELSINQEQYELYDNK